MPAIDLVTGLDRSNPPDDVNEGLEKDKYYRWITYLFLPIQYAGFVGACWLLAHGDLSAVDKVGLAHHRAERAPSSHPSAAAPGTWRLLGGEEVLAARCPGLLLHGVRDKADFVPVEPARGVS